MYSVVIPVYQAKKDLRRCVESWLTQTEADLELILVDDGSTDGSSVLCDDLAKKDQRIRVVHQKNAGVSAARNAGIQNARGDFLLFTDSDDYVASDYLEKMARIQKESNSDLVLCGFHHLYDGADILKLPGETRSINMSDFAEDFLWLYERSFLNMPWNKLFRREMAGTFDTSLSLGEDLLFNLDYLRKCRKVSVLAESLCFYIQEENRMTLSSLKRQNRMELAAKVCQETERFYQEVWGSLYTGGRIFTRYMNEVLDECEKLPADQSLSYKDKLQVIRTYAQDELVRMRGDEAVLPYLDYRILWFFLKRKKIRCVYLLCVIRRGIVVVVHRIRRKGLL
ncbi:MAG: glycosyltransferase family 2 protein [Lachnospiraceae bacterium]|nr:glycosyltransferase family 2 protein [Lachnospiraceae bacterium]